MATKYRIVKRAWFDANNELHDTFEPQYRFLGIFWSGFPNSDYRFPGDRHFNFPGDRHFDAQQDAEAFLSEVKRMGGSTSASTVVAEYR